MESDELMSDDKSSDGPQVEEDESGAGGLIPYELLPDDKQMGNHGVIVIDGTRTVATFSECGRAAIAAQTSIFRGLGGANQQISGTGRLKPANFRDRAAQTSKFQGQGAANQQISGTGRRKPANFRDMQARGGRQADRNNKKECM